MLTSNRTRPIPRQWDRWPWSGSWGSWPRWQCWKRHCWWRWISFSPRILESWPSFRLRML